MTEQEAFEQWLKTNRPACVGVDGELGVWKAACEWQRSVCNDEVICPKCCEQFRAIPVNVQHELETLRKQVEELEDAADEYKQLHGFAVNGFNRLTEELAALKQQGEPVARNQTELQDIYDTLYTSAPTIPQTCFSAADMADAAAKAAQVERVVRHGDCHMISLPIDEMLLDLRAKLEMFEREGSYAALDEVYRETRRIDCACEDALEQSA